MRVARFRCRRISSVRLTMQMRRAIRRCSRNAEDRSRRRRRVCISTRRCSRDASRWACDVGTRHAARRRRNVSADSRSTILRPQDAQRTRQRERASSVAADRGMSGSAAVAWWRSAPRSCARSNRRRGRGHSKPFDGETEIFIYPGYRFRVVDALMTNFHLPESTLLMLVCAFAGRQRVLDAYAEAVRREYRFFSYGDAMFITRRVDDAV